jgi:hypothetical protein
MLLANPNVANVDQSPTWTYAAVVILTVPEAPTRPEPNACIVSSADDGPVEVDASIDISLTPELTGRPFELAAFYDEPAWTTAARFLVSKFPSSQHQCMPPPGKSAWLQSQRHCKQQCESNGSGLKGRRAMQPAHGTREDGRQQAETKQRPGAGFRPGAVPEFQFDECTDLPGSVKPRPLKTSR